VRLEITPGQRIAVRYLMAGITSAETGSYICHRLQLGGGGGTARRKGVDLVRQPCAAAVI